METLPEDRILKFNHDTLVSVRKPYNLDKPGAMKQAVDIFEEWVKQQPHFTKKNFDREYLERLIIANKGSLERAKQRMDKGCTWRTLLPQYFGDYDLRNDFAKDLKDITHAVCPRMTKDNDRVYILRNTGKTFEPTLMISYMRAGIPYCEYVRRHDYMASAIIILDYREVNLMELASKLYLHEMHRVVTVMIEGYGFRLKELHILSNSKVVDMVVSIFKQVLPQKLKNRVRLHKDLETLKEAVDVNVLPEEYGGKDKSIDKMAEDWLDVLTSKEHVEYCKEMSRARTDESKRQTETFNEQYMGMPGSFRMLSVD